MSQHVLIDFKGQRLTMDQTLRLWSEMQRKAPGLEIFLDGDVGAIVGRARA